MARIFMAIVNNTHKFTYLAKMFGTCALSTANLYSFVCNQAATVNPSQSSHEKGYYVAASPTDMIYAPPGNIANWSSVARLRAVRLARAVSHCRKCASKRMLEKGLARTRGSVCNAHMDTNARTPFRDIGATREDASFVFKGHQLASGPCKASTPFHPENSVL